MAGYVGETVNSVMRKLHKMAGGDLEKAQRSIVFLDNMDKIAYASSVGAKRDEVRSYSHQVFSDILRIVDGTQINLSAGREDGEDFDLATEEDEEELFDTSNLFFVCFGVSEDFYKTRQNTTKHTTDKVSGVCPRPPTPPPKGKAAVPEKKSKKPTNLNASTDTTSSNESDGSGTGSDDSGIETSRLQKLELDEKNFNDSDTMNSDSTASQVGTILFLYP